MNSLSGLKTTTIFVVLLCMSAGSLHAQGTINFNNKVNAIIGPPPTPAVDAPISYPAGTRFGGPTGARIDGALHPTAMAALYAGADGTPEGQLVMVGSPVGFRSGVAAGYIDAGGVGSRLIPGVAPGAFATVQIRAWDACDPTVDSYEKALQVFGAMPGKSNLLRLATGGTGAPPGLPASLVGLQAFGIANLGSYDCPEPSTWLMAATALAFMGFIQFRRR